MISRYPEHAHFIFAFMVNDICRSPCIARLTAITNPDQQRCAGSVPALDIQISAIVKIIRNLFHILTHCKIITTRIPHGYFAICCMHIASCKITKCYRCRFLYLRNLFIRLWHLCFLFFRYRFSQYVKRNQIRYCHGT